VIPRKLSELPFVVEVPRPQGGVWHQLNDMNAWARARCGNDLARGSEWAGAAADHPAGPLFRRGDCAGVCSGVWSAKASASQAVVDTVPSLSLRVH
jgi:hypothetical protein